MATFCAGATCAGNFQAHGCFAVLRSRWSFGRRATYRAGERFLRFFPGKFILMDDRIHSILIKSIGHANCSRGLLNTVQDRRF